jgi:hypothetical protein
MKGDDQDKSYSGGRSASHQEEGYHGGYRSSEDSSRYGEGRRSGGYESESGSQTSPPGNPYGTRRGEYSGHGPGYSTANDFSGQTPQRGRLDYSEHDRAYRGYDEEDYPRYRERYRRSEYPETYRSAMGGYMSEHVGDDSGRRDYNPRPGSGNLYGNKYGPDQRRGSSTHERWDESGYMSEDDFDRGSPFYNERRMYGRDDRGERQQEGPHRGKGPRNYRRADHRVEDDINDRLTDDPMVDASDVKVEVKECEVTLSGTVDDRGAKRRAEDIAESVSGVSHVENRIRIRSGASTNPGLIVTPY